MAEFEISATIEVDGPFFDDDVDMVTEGPPGKSAYEVAVDEGFEGTVEDWLASLIGGALDPDSLGVLDPDTIQAQLREFFGLFGMTDEQADGVAAFLSGAVTDQPDDAQQALVNASKLLAFLITQASAAGMSIEALRLTDDTLGILDPDMIVGPITTTFEAFGLDQNSIDNAVDTVTAIISGREPTAPQSALLNVSAILTVLLANAALGEQATAAVGPSVWLPFDTGAESGGKWAMVCSPGFYWTPDIGAMADLAPNGYEDVIRAVPVAGDPSRTGTLTSFLEWLTQERQAPGWGDQDNKEGAFSVYRDDVGFFDEHCRIDTPPETVAGEHDPGRVYTTYDPPYNGITIDPYLKLVLGQPVTFKFRHIFNYEGNGTSRKQFLVRVAKQWATEHDDHDRYWRLVADLGYPGIDSIADSGQIWCVGLNAGLMGVEHIDRRPLGGTDDDIFLHFDTADLQEDGTIASSVVPGMVWTPDGTPYIFDTTIPGQHQALQGLAASVALKLDASEKGAPNGVAELDESGVVLSSQLPSYVDDVIEIASEANLATVLAVSGKIYVALQENTQWRWSGSTWVQMGQGVVLGETSSTAYRGDRGAQAWAHSQITTGNPHGTTAADVGAAPSGHTHTGVYEAAGAAVLKSLADAKGDLFAATGPDAVDRLAVGAVGQVVSPLSSAATGLAWQSLPVNPWPVPLSGWWSNPHEGIYTATPTLNRVMYVPIWIPPEVSQVDGIQIEVTTVGGAGAVVRLGLHRPHATTRFPDARAIDGGTLDATSVGGTGVRPLTIAATNVTPSSLMYVAVVCQGATSTLRHISTGPWLQAIGVPSTTGSDVMKANTGLGWFEAGVTGALPATASASTFNSNTVAQVLVALRRSA